MANRAANCYPCHCMKKWGGSLKPVGAQRAHFVKLLASTVISQTYCSVCTGPKSFSFELVVHGRAT